MSDALSKLPLFSTDKEIAIAVVGKERAAMWIKSTLPQLERQGFPVEDRLHGGRPAALVKLFYDAYLGIAAGFASAPPDGEEREWKPKRGRKQPD